MILTLEGFMGSGKSSVGRELARRTGWDAYDLDALIVQRAGCSIAEIFRDKGEAWFRQLETSCLEEMIARYEGSDLILALGGGAPLLNARLLHERTECVYLRASLQTILRHIGTHDATRPLFNGDIQARMDSRDPVYTEAARHIVDVDGLRTEAVAGQILRLLGLE